MIMVFIRREVVLREKLLYTYNIFVPYNFLREYSYCMESKHHVKSHFIVLNIESAGNLTYLLIFLVCELRELLLDLRETCKLCPDSKDCLHKMSQN